jgi:hypothetical protein
MQLRAFLLFVPLLEMACQSSAAPTGADSFVSELPPFPQSGSRLRAIWWEPEYGQHIFRHWRDTKLNIDCDVPNLEGASHCIPTADYADELIDPEYSDPACTHPVWGALNPEKDFLVGHTLTACGFGVRVFRLGDPLSGGPEYMWESGRCVRFSDSLAGLRPVVEVTDQMAAVEIKRSPSVGGLAGLVMVSSDGARAPWGWWDEQRQQPCKFPWSDVAAQPILAGDGRWHCLPLPDHVPQNAILVSSCATSSTVLLPSDRCATQRGNSIFMETGTCPPRMHALAPTRRVDCPMVKEEVWSLDPVAPEGLPAATLSDPQGDGRLAARWIETTAGKVLAGVWDAELGTMCKPALIGGNVTVCAPIAHVEDAGYFSESLCLKKLLTSVDCTPATFLSTVESGVGGALDRVSEVYALEPYAGMVFQSRDRMCLPAGSDRLDVAGPHFTKGRQVPLTELPFLRLAMP